MPGHRPGPSYATGIVAFELLFSVCLFVCLCHHTDRQTDTVDTFLLTCLKAPDLDLSNI